MTFDAVYQRVKRPKEESKVRYSLFRDEHNEQNPQNTTRLAQINLKFHPLNKRFDCPKRL